MKDALNRPCRECPFLRDSNPGWLGSSTAKEFIDGVDRQGAMPCHMTVDYSDPFWPHTIETDAVSYCAGAAIYLNNTLSAPRDEEWGAVVKRLGSDRVKVFAWTDEFLAHHDNEMNRRYVEASERNRTRTAYPIAEEELDT